MATVPAVRSLVQLLGHRAQWAPEVVAYLFLSDDGQPESLTHGQLDARAKFIAAHLQGRRIPRGQPVLLLFQPGLDYIASFFGCLYAGAIPVPAYPPTSARRLPRLQALLDDAQAPCAITTSADLQRINILESRQEKLSIKDWLVLDQLQEPPAQWVDPGASANTIAFLQYTSGSTSSPKGVMVSHGNLLKNLEHVGRAIGVQDSDVTVSWLPPYHDFGLIGGILNPLFWGHRCVFMRPASFLLNPYRWLKAICDHRGSITSAPNFAYDLCVRSTTPEQLATLDLRSWRVASNGAEPVRVETVRGFIQTFGSCGFRAESMVPGYGLAEATLVVTAVQDTPAGQAPTQLSVSKSALQRQTVEPWVERAEGVEAVSLISVGKVLPEHEVAIVDPHSLKRASADAVGEVWVRGPCVAHGYWNRPDATESTFKAFIAGTDEGPYLRTGDLGFFHDGQMFICGRLKDLINVKGRNIYPQDVESASFASHPKLRVDGAIAFGVEHEQAERLVVVQELDFRVRADEALFGAIAAAVAEEVGLPPDSIVLVKAGQLPRTSSGKIQRQLCKQQFQEGDLPVQARWERPAAGPLAGAALPAPVEPVVPSQPEALPSLPAVAEMQRWLIDRLAARVGIPAPAVDPQQPFAYYGLDSLASVQLAQELSDRLQCAVAPTVFWDHPSITQLSLHLVHETAAKRPSADSAEAVAVSAATPAAAEPIAIIGMGCRFPQAGDIESFWTLLEQGRGVTGPVPAPRIAARTFIRGETAAPQLGLGGFLDQVDRFDPQFFGISPLEADRIDPQQRLVLELAWEALERAGVPPARLAGTRTGVFVGLSTHDYESLQVQADDGLTVYAATGSAPSIAANRLSYLLDLRGPSMAVDTACSSSLVAVHLACQSLRNGESTLALAGGVNLILSSQSGTPFASAGMLAADGRCKAFDAAADGYVRGEGCGMVVLKRLSQAQRDGDPIHAVIRGSAIGQDGRSNGLIAPNGAAQVEVLRRAMADAQLAPTSITYLEAHGTGTALGDPIELRALKEVLLPGRSISQACAIGTVKTNIGHLEAAAGVAGLIKTALALEKAVIPPSLNFQTPNPHCSLEGTPLRVATQSQSWGGLADRVAGVSSFGFGGALAHVVLQQADAAPASGAGWPWQLMSFSAKTESALEAMSDALAERLAAAPDIALADVAYTHQLGRNAFGVRRVLVCVDAADAAQALRNRAADRVRTSALPSRPAQVVFMFPGQGAQEVGMARELYQHLPVFRAEVDACAAIVQQQGGYDIRELIGLTGKPAPAAAAQLMQTQHAQPALFVIGYAMARLWMRYGLKPQAMIGHSLGEYVAACLAGVFSLEDALALVGARGRLMQVLPAGAMLSVGLDEAGIQPHLNSDLSLAAVNGRDRCVVSGTFDAVRALELKLTAQGVSNRRLQTSHAFHSHLMDPVLDDFGALLDKVALHAPTLAFVSNLTGRWITPDEATSPAYWLRHLREPVRFAQGLATLAELTAATDAVLVEAGPGRTLSTLARQHAAAADCPWTTLASMAAAPAQTSDLAQHLATLGQLWLAGQAIDWHLVYAGQQRRRLPLPTYPFERQRHWINSSRAEATASNSAHTTEATVAPPPLIPTDKTLPVRRTADIERETCVIVAELLQIEPHKVDPHAPLLELGADSLILVQAVNRIKKQFGITLSIRQLFEELTTISALAGFIAQQIEPVAATAVADMADMTEQPATAAVALAAPERPVDTGEPASMLERTIARQLESLAQITQQTTQVLLQQLEAVKASTRGDAAAGAARALPVVVQPPAATPAAPAAPAAAAVTAFSRSVQFDPYAQLTPQQSAYLQRFMRRFLERTQGSKGGTAAHKAVHADYRAQAGFRFSASDPVLPLTLHELFYPILCERAAGSRIWDVDGNEYIDLTMGFGVHFFGHGPDFIQQALQHQMQLGTQIGPQSPMAGEVAQLVHELTGMERVAFCNSGTEAVMLAIRLARTGTGRKKFVMFNGSYHGWSDGSLVGLDLEREERGAAAPLMPGLMPGVGQQALVLEYAEAESLDIIRQQAHELAAVIVEPVQGRHPELQPREFLHRLRALTKELGIALIFDEVITGFRLHPGGAQALFGIRADIATYGKAAGGGMPLGMVAGAARYMDGVDGGPRSRADGRTSAPTTFFAGTFSKHPLTMAATRAVLQRMKREGPALQEALTRRTTGLVERINQMFASQQVPMRLVQCGSLFRLNTTSNLDLFCYHLVAHGLYIWEGRNMFLSTAHSDADLDRIFHAFEASVRDLREGGFLPPLPPPLSPASGATSTPLALSSQPAADAVAADEAVAAAVADATLALTATQQGIWLECRLDDEAKLAYNTSIALRLAGAVDRAALGAALQHVVDRHDALRTVIDPSGESQHVRAALRIELPVVPFAQSDDPAAQMRRWQDEESLRPFDLSQGPLLRASLLQESAGEYLLCLTVHHVVSDGISDALLVQELAQAYSALRQGASAALPAAQALREHVVQRQAYLGSEQCRKDEAYWMARFAQMPPPLALPVDRPAHRQASLLAQRQQFIVGPQQVRDLQQFSRQHNCTLFMTLMAAFSVLLQRLTHQEDLVIGIPVTVDRTDGYESHLIACTLNIVPVRCRPQASLSFVRYLAEIKTTLVEAYLHASYPFALLTRRLGAAHDPRRRPLASVMFNIDRPADLPVFDGLQASLAESPMRFGQDDLMIDITQLPDQLIVKLQYKQDLFDDSTIARLSGHLQELLAGIVAFPDTAIAELPLLGAAERHRLLVEWNDTAQVYEGAQTIQGLFEEQVRRTPDRQALVYEASELTYAELNEQANWLAHHLMTLGVGPDVRVGICVERSVEMVVGLLAVLKAGGAYLPLDPAYPAERLAYMVQDAGPAVLLTQSQLLDRLPQQGCPTVCLDRDAQAWSMQPAGNPQVATLPAHLAYVIYTSGSTGRPKGAGVDHAGIVNRLQWMQQAYTLTAADRVLQKTPFSFDVSVWEFFWPLMSGATLVVARPGGHQDVDYLSALIEAQAITTLHFVPPMLEVFLNAAPANRCRTLRQVMCSGQALPLELQQRFMKWLPASQLHNLYGPTEASVDVTAWECRADGQRGCVPIGKPIANIQIHVLDAQGQPVPVGVSGELHIAGIGLARGYLGRPGLTAEKFVPNPFGAPGSRMYRSGDLVRYLPDGAIEYLGRIDDQVKIRGLRIELGEIEATLAAQPGVRDAVVLVREDVPGDQRLVAYLLSETTANDTGRETALRAALARTLPEYMVPAHIVWLAQFPLSPNGKIDRKALPAPDVQARSRGYEEPQGELETRIAAIWAELLRLERVGRHDNFFELGGHSLLAVRLIERVRHEGLQLDARLLYAAPSVAGLAAAIRPAQAEAEVLPNGIPEGCRALTPEMLTLATLTAKELGQIVQAVPGGAANIQDVYPLTPLQQGIWFHHLVSQGRDAYVMASLLALDTRERVDTFVAALQVVVDRHDILRTAVLWEGLAAPMQVVCRHAPLVVEEIALDGQQGDLADQLRALHGPGRFLLDIRSAPLMRGFLVHDPRRGRWLLQILVHHLVCDHSTLELLIGEVQAILAGQSAQLPRAWAFRDFVARLNRANWEDDHRAFFIRMLADVETASVPFGLLDVKGDGADVAEARLAIGLPLARRARQQARKHGVSVASLMHLAWAQVLARLLGQQDVVFGTVLLGRMQGQAGIERMLGLFTNTLPVRITVGAGAVAQSLRDTHALLSELLAHEHAPLALAQRCSGVAPPMPLFSALLNYRYGAAGAEAHDGFEGVQILSEEERTNYPVAMSIDDLSEGFELVAQCAEPAQAQPLCDYLHTVLQHLVAALETAPDTPADRIEALPAAARQRQLVEWNDTACGHAGPATIHQLFEAQVARTPQQVALVVEDRELTYVALNEQANRLAHHLIGLGLGPDMLVGVCMDRSVEMVVGLLGVLKAGGAYVPLDPAYPAERLGYMLKDARPGVLLTQRHLLPTLPRFGGARICLDDPAADWQRLDGNDPVPRSLPAHLAYVIYTSGSTGRPKGVAVSHGGVANFLHSMRQAPGMDAGDVLLSVTSLSFDIAALELFLPLVCGARTVLTTREQATDPQQLAALLERHRVTVMQATPSTWRMLVDAGWPAQARALKVLCGGEALPVNLLHELLHQVPTIWNLYGPTETTIWSAAQRITAADPVPLIGRPIANTRIYLLDAAFQPVPVGVAGELYIAGDGLARGYLHRPDLTAERFLPDPFAGGGARMYRAGDLARYTADGRIEYLGRVDNQVKLRGFRIELGEIESALCALPQVRQAIVLAREDSPGDRRLVAYVLPHDAAQLPAEPGAAWRPALAATLPEYMLPAHFVVLAAFPLTPNGKIDHKDLPAPEAPQDRAAYVAPRNATEETLAALCAEVLQLDRVGIHDSFFALGGHSLLATQMTSRIRQEFGINLPVRALFETSTVAELAERVSNLLRLLHAPAAADAGVGLEEIEF